MPLRLGLPDLNQARVGFVNDFFDADALGGEAQVIWRHAKDWMFWCNVGIREVKYLEPWFRETVVEPTTRLNLGGRYLPEHGWFTDVSLHYVSDYTTYLPNPEELLERRRPMELGHRIMLLARLGYRMALDAGQSLEAGLTVRTPLGSSFREFMGEPMPAFLQTESAADYGGELLTRLVAGYLRVWF